MEELPVIKPHVRTALLTWISKAGMSKDKRTRTDEGWIVTLLPPQDGRRFILRCEDGNLEMPAYKLVVQRQVI